MVVCKIHYSLENFCGASRCGHNVLYTASDSRGKLSRLAEKLQKLKKFSPSKHLLCTVRFFEYNILDGSMYFPLSVDFY